jgi:serine/threonine protein kinase/Tfp pilus assembly protein PilF
MTIANGELRMRDELLDEVVVAYLEAVEAGQRPDAQEWLARYPELASELEVFFADQDKVQRWTAPLRDAARTISTVVRDWNSTVEYSPSSPLPAPIGQFGDYVLLREISRGGMGIVYLARQVSLHRLVAVKLILAGHLASQDDVQRFHTEAVSAAHLDHPNIVPVYEVGEFNGQHFYSMKLMEGGSLADRLAEWSGRPREAAALMLKVAGAVHHAHQRGILHRDLKPGNVLLDTPGEPHVSDFGLAKGIEDTTHSGVVAGTPSYMAPEQAISQGRLTTAADIYSLGAILYALLTGKPPFRAGTRLETLQQVTERSPAPPRTLNARVDQDLDTICLKCLAKSPSERYASAQALADDLHRYLAGEPILARPTPVWVRCLKWAKRRPAGAALLAVCLVTCFSLITGYLEYQNQRASVAEQALNEHRRADSVRNKVGDLVLKGQEAMLRSQWSEAKVHLASARELLGAEPALGDLVAPVEQLLGETERQVQQEWSRWQVVTQYLTFTELRDQSLFQGTLFTGIDLPANRTNLRAMALKALSAFGVDVETSAGPVLLGPFSPAERKDVKESCYELLLFLAETMAQDDSREMEQALLILDRAAKLGPPTRAYHLQRARYLERLGDKASAKEENDQAAALQPVVALDYFLMGEELQRRGQVPRAISAFQNALRLHPNHFWARYFLSVCYLRLRPSRPDLASDSLTACLSQGRNVVWVYLLRGFSFGQLELFQAAEDDFQKALECEPNADARYAIFVNRGVLFSRQRKFVQAVADLKQAIAIRSNPYQAYSNLAKVYQQQKQFALAIGELDSAIEAGTRLVQAGQLEPAILALLYRNRALLQLDRQEPRSALADFQQAIHLDCRAEDHIECARIFHGLGRFPEALKAYETALGAAGDHANAYLGRAETLLKLEKYKEALVSLDDYLKGPNPHVSPNLLADVYRARGLTGVELGQYADAIADFTLALNLKDDSRTHGYRGWAYLVSKAPHLAWPDFEKAIQLDEGNADAFNGRAAVRVKLGTKLGQYQEAIADAEKALHHAPKKDPRIRWNAARIYAQVAAKLVAEQNGEILKIRAAYREQALRLLRQTLELTPASKRASFWRTHIQGDPDLSDYAERLSSG